MSKDEYMQKIAMEELNSRNGCFVDGLRIAMIFIVAIIILSSCATNTKIEYRDRIVDHYNTVVQHDTLREHTSDSIFEKIYVKGDTVYNTKYVEKMRWRDRVVERHDTCWRDSITTEYKETMKEVVKYPKTYWWFLGFTILFFIFAFVKLKKWLKIF